MGQPMEERLEELTDQLQKGIMELYASGRYGEYLAAMSKFHHYSFGNAMLILLQCPNATRVAGYNTWRKEFGRNVKRHEKEVEAESIAYINEFIDPAASLKENVIRTILNPSSSVYHYADNLLRFFYTYVYSNKSALQMLGAEAFYEEYIEPSIVTFISYRFEDICRTYFSRQVQSRKMRGILNIGTYYYDDPKKKRNGEFDVVLQRREAFDVYEAKYFESPMTRQQMHKEIKQISEIEGLPVGKIGFISVNGFVAAMSGYECIDGAALYEN